MLRVGHMAPARRPVFAHGQPWAIGVHRACAGAAGGSMGLVSWTRSSSRPPFWG